MIYMKYKSIKEFYGSRWLFSGLNHSYRCHKVVVKQTKKKLRGVATSWNIHAAVLLTGDFIGKLYRVKE